MEAETAERLFSGELLFLVSLLLLSAGGGLPHRQRRQLLPRP